MGEPTGQSPRGQVTVSSFSAGATDALVFDFNDALNDGDKLCVQALFTSGPTNLIVFLTNEDLSTCTWANVKDGTKLGIPFIVLARNNLGQPLEFDLASFMNAVTAKGLPAAFDRVGVIMQSGTTANLEIAIHITRKNTPGVETDEFNDAG